MMPVSEIESKEKHDCCSRERDMEISENIQMREKQRGRAIHSQICHLCHHNGSRDRASELIGVKSPEDAGE